jgi:hypothetical protein
VEKGGYDTREDDVMFLRHSEIFLDPSFWQALGKARYYTKDTKEGSIRSKLWLQDWHRFIDHLAEGMDAESFFNSLN